MSQRGKLTLIGAGPGDPELITLKAVKELKKAEVVLYDALVNEEVLNHCPDNCERVFVGKKPGVHRNQQIEINELIVKYGQSGKHVARLKGGDSYIFGRGHEEEVFALEHGMAVEVIPGISSFYSVPELNRLPLTRRGLSESFWVLTGTTKDLELAEDLTLAATSNSTVVVLMGMKKLPEIVQLFQEQKRSTTPIAIIQNGSLPSQKIGVGTIDTILTIVKEKALSSPAIIVIGEVVKTILA